MDQLSNIINVLRTQQGFVHFTTSGGGTLVQDDLWRTPGSSAWVSGTSMPYDLEETNDFLGFKSPGVKHETAIHLAAAAYMKAFRYGRPLTIGLGMTTSVASSVPHRGDHRIHSCIITSNDCWTCDVILPKNVGELARIADNHACSDVAYALFETALGLQLTHRTDSIVIQRVDPTRLLDLVMERPVFLATGVRTTQLPTWTALMPGAYNPPHDGHFGIADLVNEEHGRNVVHHVTIDQPHKAHLTAQGVLERAKLLKGRNAFFTRGDALYLDKARRFPGLPIVMGADALDRILDPEWGVPTDKLLEELELLKTTFYVNARTIDGTLKTCESILSSRGLSNQLNRRFISLGDRLWDISSTEVRNAALHSR